MTARPRARIAVTAHWLEDHLDTPLCELPLMTTLLLCRSLAARLRGQTSLSVVRSMTSPRQLLEWFAAEHRRDPGPTPPDTLSARVRLRPVDERDLPVLYRAWCDPGVGAAWIARGSTPSWQEFPTTLWSGVDAAFIGEEVITGEPVALAVSYGYDATSACVFAGVLGLGQRHDVALGAETILELFAKLFADRPIRRIVLEVPEYNWWIVDGVVQEGALPTLPEHRFHDGRWWDVLLATLDRAGHADLVAIDREPVDQLLRLARRCSEDGVGLERGTSRTD